MPRSAPLHKDTGSIVYDRFFGVDTKLHPTKLSPGELAESFNNTSRFESLQKTTGWVVVNGADLRNWGGAQSRMTDDHILFNGSNAAPVTGVIPYAYTSGASSDVVRSRLAFCDRQLYAGIDDPGFLPNLPAHKLHAWSSVPGADRPVWAEWDGNLFLSIGRATTAGAADGVQVVSGTTVTSFQDWAAANINALWTGDDLRPRFMAVNWGYLVFGSLYNSTTGSYEHSTIHAVDLNGTADTWLFNVLGDGGDSTGSPINGMTAYGDHILVFSRHSDIIRLSWLSDLNVEGINVGGAIITDRDRRITYQNGCASGHSIVTVGKRLLWLADNGIWMLETSDSLTPVRVSEKLDGVDGIWSRINKAAIEGACAIFDEEQQQVLFSVPYDDSTINNKVIVAQLPANDYESADYRTWSWGLRDRTAASMAYDQGTRTVIWGSSLASGLCCEDKPVPVAGAFAETNVGVSTFSPLSIVDSGNPFKVDELIGMPVVYRIGDTGAVVTAWIADSTGSELTFSSEIGPVITAAPGEEYYVGGINWLCVLGDKVYEDPMFLGTGYVTLGVDGFADVQVHVYTDNRSVPLVSKYQLYSPGTVPVAVPFSVGVAQNSTEKIYLDSRTVSFRLAFNEIGYTGTPYVTRVDVPTSRITRTRDR